MNGSIAANPIADVGPESIWSYWATLAPPEVIGPLAEGVRVHFYVIACEVTGPKMQRRLRTVGGDWLRLRTDGVGMLDVCATMELDDGALIYTTYGGVVDLGPDGYKPFSKKNSGFTPRTAYRAAVLHKSCGLLVAEPAAMRGGGVFEVGPSRVSYDVYAMR